MLNARIVVDRFYYYFANLDEKIFSYLVKTFHQIPVAPQDIEKIVIITLFTFGLRNVAQ